MSDSSLRGFALRSMGSKKEVTVRPASAWISYATHFATRTLLCPGEGCVACPDSPARDVCVTWGLVDLQPGLMVLSSSAANMIGKAIASQGYIAEEGVVELLLRRSSTRRPWVVEGTRRVAETLVRPPAGDIAMAVARLVGIPVRYRDPDFCQTQRLAHDWAVNLVKREWAKVMLF